MPHSWKLTSDNLILKRKDIYEKHYQHTIQNWPKHWTGKSCRRHGPCRHVQRSSKNDGELIMELAAIQIMLFGVIILVYLAEEFNK